MVTSLFKHRISAEKFFRKIIWPFTSSYKFVRVWATEVLRIFPRLRLLEHQTYELEQKNSEMIKLVEEHILLRSELVALKNRYAVLDALDEKTIQLEHSLTQLRTTELLLTNTANGIFIGKRNELISDFISEGGVWDKHIIEVALGVAKDRQGEAIDVGAHLGSVTLALAEIFERVSSFEPNDFNFKLLQANVAINSLKNVSLFNSALYSHSTQLSLGDNTKQEIPILLDELGEFDGRASKNLGAYLFSENGSGIFEKTSKTLDSYEFKKVSFIKVDVQGADGEVLMGALRTVRKWRPVIVFEWEELLSRNFNVSLDGISAKLHELGYEISVLKMHNDKQIDYLARPTAGWNKVK